MHRLLHLRFVCVFVSFLLHILVNLGCRRDRCLQRLFGDGRRDRFRCGGGDHGGGFDHGLGSFLQWGNRLGCLGHNRLFVDRFFRGGAVAVIARLFELTGLLVRFARRFGLGRRLGRCSLHCCATTTPGGQFAHPFAHGFCQADAQHAHVVRDLLPEPFLTTLVED